MTSRRDVGVGNNGGVGEEEDKEEEERTRRKRRERRGKGGGRGEREERRGGEPKQDKDLRRKGRVTNFSTQVKYKQNVSSCF